MEEYIIACNSSELNVRQKAADEQFCHGAMTEMYGLALDHHKDLKYGDPVPWNNQLWGVVEAESIGDALSVFKEKLKKDR